MDKHEEKICLRCNAVFECKLGNISQCQCTTIQLTTAERQYIGEKYEDCLCRSCLEKLKGAYHLLKQEL